MRLFVAINLPDSEKRRLDGVLNELREAATPIRWVDPDSLHLTVKFLGSVPAEKTPMLTGALTRAVSGIRSFEIELAGFGVFPTSSRPNIVWVGITAVPALARVQERVEAELEPLGFARETRAFHPHITIGRARKQAAPIDRGALDRMLAPLVYKSVIMVESLDLMRSHTDSRGARYERIERHGLSG